MDHGTIKIKSGFLFLQWVFFIFKPTISVDGGEPQKQSWGESTHSVSPGQHTVQLEIPYLFFKVGKAKETLDVAAGETVSMTYRAPLFLFWRGKFKPVMA